MLRISWVTRTDSSVILLGGAEDMGIVLGEGRRTRMKPVQSAGGLVTVDLAELGDAQRQLAVTAHPLA